MDTEAARGASMLLFHYTSLSKLSGILNDRHIRPSRETQADAWDTWLPDVVWLTSAPTDEMGHGMKYVYVVEDGRIRAVTDFKREVSPHMQKGRVRIAVEVEAERWLDTEERASWPRPARKAFARRGGGRVAESTWYIYRDKIKAAQWAEIAIDGDVVYSAENDADSDMLQELARMSAHLLPTAGLRSVVDARRAAGESAS